VGNDAGDVMTRRLVAPRRGQNMVEFALGVSILMLLTMGIVDFGQAIWNYNTVAYLAREGARYGVAPSRTPNQIRSYTITRAALPGLSTSNVAVEHRGVCGNLDDPVNGPVKVTVSYTYTPATPMLAILVGSSINLSSTASMYVEKGLSADCACGGTC
jgi:Flp pilus assembly protein TadG